MRSPGAEAAIQGSSPLRGDLRSDATESRPRRAQGTSQWSGQLGLDSGLFFETYDRWKTKILNYFDARQTSAAVEGINNKARVITKRTYGLKSAKSLWDRLILDLNRASQAIGYSIEHIRQMAKGLKALLDWSCT